MTMTNTLDSAQRNPFAVYNRNGTLAGWRWIDEAGRSSTLYPTMQAALTATLRHITSNDPRPVPWWKHTLRNVAQYLENAAR